MLITTAVKSKDLKKKLRRLKKGDKKAFDLIFYLYYKKIYYFCVKYFYSKEDSEEIVQEIFVKIWMNRSSIDPEKNFEQYIYAIAKNYIINDIRNKISRRAKFKDYHLTQNGIHNSVEEEVYYNELEGLLYNAIKNLPSKRKEIFILNRIKGLSNREISEKLDISVKTVEAQMKLAIDYFKKVFESRTY